MILPSEPSGKSLASGGCNSFRREGQPKSGHGRCPRNSARTSPLL